MADDKNKMIVKNSSVIAIDRDDKFVRLKLSGNPDLYKLWLERHNAIMIELTGSNTLELLDTQTPNFLEIKHDEATNKYYINYIYDGQIDTSKFMTKTPKYLNVYAEGGFVYIDIILDNLYTTENTSTGTDNWLNFYKRQGINNIDFIGSIRTETPDSIEVRKGNDGFFVVNFKGTGGGGTGIQLVTTDTPGFINVINENNEAKVDFSGDITTKTPNSLTITKDSGDGKFNIDFIGDPEGDTLKDIVNDDGYLDCYVTDYTAHVNYVGPLGKRFGSFVIAGPDAPLDNSEIDFRADNTDDFRIIAEAISLLPSFGGTLYIHGTLVLENGEVNSINNGIGNIRIVGVGNGSGFIFRNSTSLSIQRSNKLTLENLTFQCTDAARRDSVAIILSSGQTTSNNASDGLTFINNTVIGFTRFLYCVSSTTTTRDYTTRIINNDFINNKQSLYLFQTDNYIISGNTFDNSIDYDGYSYNFAEKACIFFYQPDEGIYKHNKSLSITNNKFINGLTQIALNGDDPGIANYLKNITITDNNFTYFGEQNTNFECFSLYATNLYASVISNNIFTCDDDSKNTISSIRALLVDNNPNIPTYNEMNVISNNTVYNHDLGFLVRNFKNSIISDNNLISNWQSAPSAYLFSSPEPLSCKADSSLQNIVTLT